MYELIIVAGPNYPKVHPEIRFVSKINMPYVNQRNGVIDSSFPPLANWASFPKSFEVLLQYIQKEMAQPQNARLPQPPEGSRY